MSTPSEPDLAPGASSNSSDLPPQWALLQMVTGHYVSRAIYVAAKLGVADLLSDGPRHYREIAGSTGAHAPSLYRLLRLLTSAGVFAENESGCFSLTPVGSHLRSGVPGSRRAQALLLAGPAQQRSWGKLLDIVKTGDLPSGRPTFQFLAQFSEEAAIFNDAMTSTSLEAAAAVIDAYDYSCFNRIIELGGGHGVLLSAILAANPSAHGVLFDLLQVTQGAHQHIGATGLKERCEVASGDFFQEVPAGGDAYVLKSVIHDWDDTSALAILRNVHRAMAPHAKLLLVEMVLPERVDLTPETQFAARSDLNMLVNLGGRERTEGEFRVLLEQADFQLTRVIPTKTPWSLIEGVRLG